MSNELKPGELVPRYTPQCKWCLRKRPFKMLVVRGAKQYDTWYCRWCGREPKTGEVIGPSVYNG